MADHINDLPELGTRAAAVAAIESLIYRALCPKDVEPTQLRYWLDAYYQARFAAAREEQEDKLLRRAQDDRRFYAPECKPRADVGIGPYEAERREVGPIRAEDVDRCGELDEFLRKTLREQAARAGIEVEDERIATAAEPPRNDSKEDNGADVSAPPRMRARRITLIRRLRRQLPPLGGSLSRLMASAPTAKARRRRRRPGRSRSDGRTGSSRSRSRPAARPRPRRSSARSPSGCAGCAPAA